MSNEDHVVELLAAYALGALEAGEAAQVEAHLALCAACREELRAYEAITGELALAVAEVEPPASLRQQLMANVKAPGREVEQQKGPSLWQQLLAYFRQHRAMAFSQLALAALVLLLLASTVILWQQVNKMGSAAPPGRLQAIRLNGTGVIPGAEGYLTVSGDGLSGAIVLDQVPQLAESQQYQLWLVKDDGARVSAALLSVDELGYGGGRVRAPESLFNYSSAEVTIEPSGGSRQPTTDAALTAPLFP
jgi:anti-sigma-K factor RskA